MSNVHQLFPEPTPAVVGNFDEAWRLYPNKSNKAVARAKYLAIIQGGFRTRTLDKSSNQFFEMELSATHEQIVAGIKAYVASQIDRNTYRLRDEGRFIPHLATWLGRAGWQDFE